MTAALRCLHDSRTRSSTATPALFKLFIALLRSGDLGCLEIYIFFKTPQIETCALASGGVQFTTGVQAKVKPGNPSLIPRINKCKKSE